jgi:DNA-packaging protein gp3
MGAPKGNEFWKLRSKHGRDSLFQTPELMWEAACEYFQWCVDNPLMESQVVRSCVKAEKDKDGNPVYVPDLVEVPHMRAFTIHGLCLYLDANTLYFRDFEEALKEKIATEKDEEKLKVHKEFSLVISRVREIIYNQKFEGAAAGFLNHHIIARDLGLADRKELQGVKDGPPIPIEGKITHNVNFKKSDGSAG